jgi:hypothetical protein
MQRERPKGYKLNLNIVVGGLALPGRITVVRRGRQLQLIFCCHVDASHFEIVDQTALRSFRHSLHLVR